MGQSSSAHITSSSASSSATASSSSSAAASLHKDDAKLLAASKPAATFLKINPRKCNDRGHHQPADWLNTYHTFSFASYYNPKFSQFHSLRVLNEDRVAPASGFGTHPHNNYEIFSYVVSGAIRHRDSMNNDETLGRGFVQFTSAGTGIRHSEYNASNKDLLHFLQIWVKPRQQNLKPSYQTKYFDDSEKKNSLRLIVSPNPSDDVVTINQDVRVHASLLDANQTVSLPVSGPDREFYIHVVDDVTGFETEARETAVLVNDSVTLASGDGAFITQTPGKYENGHAIVFRGASSNKNKPVEFLVFDVAATADADADADDDDM